MKLVAQESGGAESWMEGQKRMIRLGLPGSVGVNSTSYQIFVTGLRYRRRVFLADFLVDLVRRDFDPRGGLRGGLPPALAAVNSRRFLAAQPGLFDCRPRAMPSPSAGTFSVIVDPAAI